MPLPSRPPPDKVRELHELYIQKTADEYAKVEKDYIDRLLGRLLGLTPFWWLGRCSALDTTGKTATVQLDPIPETTGLPPVPSTVTAQWGRASWTAAQVVGKRVRVGYSPLRNYFWLIDTVTHE